MSGTSSATQWPLLKFYFSVTGFSDTPITFQEVTGLEKEVQDVEYRDGAGPNLFPIKMPGLSKVGNVTFKKGIFLGDHAFWTWLNGIQIAAPTRTTVVVSLIDESAAVQSKWTLNNAFPTKYAGTDLKSDGNEVAIESLEVAYEYLTVG